MLLTTFVLLYGTFFANAANETTSRQFPENKHQAPHLEVLFFSIF